MGILCRTVWGNVRLLVCLALAQGARAQQQDPTALQEPLKGVKDGAAIAGQQLVGHFVNGTHDVLGKAQKDISSLFPPKQTTSSTQPAVTATPVVPTSTPPSSPGAASTTPQASTPLPSTILATTVAAVASTPPPTTVPASTPSIPPSTSQAATTPPPTTSSASVPMHGFRVLATGGQNTGIIKTSQLYSDVTGKWTTTGSMTTPRRLFNIVRLLDGRALLAGGIDILAAVLPGGAAFITTNNPGTTITELYNATSGSWAETGMMTTPRTLFQMVVLQNGNVLATGGCLDPTDFTSCHAQASAEVYSPGTGNWSATGSMSTSRIYFQMVALRNGKALAAGGFAEIYNGATLTRVVPLSSAEVYDPLTGNWTSTGSMSRTRVDFKMVLLPDGRVLAAGGTPDNYNVPTTPESYNSSEIYDPATGLWSPTGSMISARVDPQMVSLLNGNVLVAGGYDYTEGNVYSAEVYDSNIGMWKATGAAYAAPGRTSRFDFVMVALPDGNALAAGGFTTTPNFGPYQYSTTSEVYNTTTGNWNLTSSSSTGRVDFGMVVL